MPEIKTISCAETKKLLDNGAAILIDVREPGEYRSAKIPGAKNIPLSQIKSKHIQNPISQKIILHCKTGKRSREACAKVIADLKDDIYTMAGGMDAWRAADLDVEQGNSFVLPLDQQVQITIGAMILAGLLIYQFATSFGLILPLIAGLGLINAGLTGWCGLAKGMARMPWNR